MKRYDLNSAVKKLATAFGYTVGIRRTYGGADTAVIMKISWQLLQGTRVCGMVDLICSDGYGTIGQEWHGEIQVSAPSIDYRRKVLTPWEKQKGRKAKRITRQNFVLKIDLIISEIQKMRMAKPVTRELAFIL